MTKLTTATVNKELKRLGFEERLYRGNGYYYFAEGGTPYWESSSVFVPAVTDLTLQEWVDEVVDRKKEEESRKPL